VSTRSAAAIDRRVGRYDAPMTDEGRSIAEQLDELEAQLDWVREYL
jgi:hypothetical protein